VRVAARWFGDMLVEDLGLPARAVAGLGGGRAGDAYGRALAARMSAGGSPLRMPAGVQPGPGTPAAPVACA
jgi:hypothetical protein